MRIASRKAASRHGVDRGLDVDDQDRLRAFAVKNGSNSLPKFSGGMPSPGPESRALGLAYGPPGGRSGISAGRISGYTDAIAYVES